MPIPKWLIPPGFINETEPPSGMVPISIFGEKPDKPLPPYDPSDFGPGPFPLADESIPRTTPEAIFKPFELEAQTLGRAIARPSMKGQTVLPEPPTQDVSQLMVEYERAGGFDALPPEIQEFASNVMAPSNLLALAPEQALKAVPAIGKGLLAASRYPLPLMAEAGRIAKPIARELATGQEGALRITKGTSQGKQGFILRGEDAQGRRVDVFTETKAEADIAKANIRAGQEPFAAEAIPEAIVPGHAPVAPVAEVTPELAAKVGQWRDTQRAWEDALQAAFDRLPAAMSAEAKALRAGSDPLVRQAATARRVAADALKPELMALAQSSGIKVFRRLAVESVLDTLERNGIKFGEAIPQVSARVGKVPPIPEGVVPERPIGEPPRTLDELYETITKNESIHASDFVRGLHKAGIDTIETHLQRDAIFVRVDRLSEKNRRAIEQLPDASVHIEPQTTYTPGFADTTIKVRNTPVGVRNVLRELEGQGSPITEPFIWEEVGRAEVEYLTAKALRERAAAPIPKAPTMPPEIPPVEPPPRGPTEPPVVPPGGESPFGATPPPQDPAAKLTALVRAAKPIRRETETLRTGERARRAAIGQKAFEGAEGREAFYQARAKLGGELPKGQFTPPEAGLTPEDVTGLFEQIKAKEPEFFERISTSEALDTLLGGQLPTQSQIERLEKIFGPELAKAILGQRSWGQKAWEIFVDALNVPRTLQSAYDFSAPLRQGAILFAGHPVKGAKAFAPMFKAAFSEKTALAIDTAIRRSKWADVREAAGLYLAPLSGVSSRLGGREEAFMSRLAAKVPGVRMSERAYNTYLNKIRADVFDGVVARWEQLGIKASEKDYSDLARFINLASGRGEIPRNLEGLAPVLNGLFFSPRLQMSRFEMPFHIVRGTPLARKEMARNLVAFVGANATLGGLLAASRLATVELDPRSADFGKAKIGNTRIDLWAGYQQYARLVATLATGERKSAKGNIYSVPRGELFMRGVQSKFSPIAGLVTDVLRGQTYMGDELKMEPATIIDQAYNRLAPLFAQDLIDAIRDSGLVGGFLAAPGLFGAGVQTYGASPLEKLQQEVSGGRWEELTPAERKVLERQNPTLRTLIGETYAQEAGAGQDYAERKSQQVALEDERDEKLLAIAKETMKNGMGENYLKRRGAVMQDYYSRTDQLWKSFPAKETTDVNEKAFSEYMGVPLVYDAATNEYGFSAQEAQQKALLASFTPEQRAYIEREKKLWPERFPPEVAQLERRYQEDKPLLTKYYGVADALWDANPQAKQQRDRAAQQPNPQVRAAIRAAVPQIAAIEKQIALRRAAMRRSDPQLEKAVLFWTRTVTPIQLKKAG